MPEPRRFDHLREVCSVALAALVIECCIARAAWAGARWWIWLPAHLAVALGLSLWCYRSPAHRADVRMPLLVALFTAVLGPVGAGGALAAIGLAAWYSRAAVPFEEWHRSMFPESANDPAAELIERLASSDPEDNGNLAAFADVLRFGSLRQKQAVIALVTQRYRPAFGPILKLALTDSQNTIRVEAATAMSRIEKSIMRQTLELQRKARENPDSLEVLQSLAQHFDDQVYANILDPKREQDVRSRALAAYRRLIAAQPADSGARVAAGRLLLRDRQYREAAECLESAIQEVLSNPRACLWYMESLFRLGRFDTLREMASRHQAEFESWSDFPVEALEAIRLWAAGA